MKKKKKTQHFLGIYPFRELLAKLLAYSSNILILTTTAEIHLLQVQLDLAIVLIMEMFLNKREIINSFSRKHHSKLIYKVSYQCSINNRSLVFCFVLFFLLR